MRGAARNIAAWRNKVETRVFQPLTSLAVNRAFDVHGSLALL